jgi:hypothetical protein
MTPAFWDTSALVPLCVQQHPSSAVRELLGQHEITVWWATSVEMRSAFERLLRMGQLTQSEHVAALQLAAAWTWCSGDVQGCTFISGDAQLLEAARQVGFRIVLS